MRQLPQVTLCAVDCVNPRAALHALQASCEQIVFAQVLLLTDQILPVPTWVTLQSIPSLQSKADYSRFVIKQLADYITTDFVLLVQWDGYVIDANAWQDRFLDYDYIGALWSDGQVGNGGFSLRSKRLLLAGQDACLVDCEPEDQALAIRYRELLEVSYGVCFAPPKVAAAFAYERVDSQQPTLGFHGAFHLWRYLSSDVWDAWLDDLNPHTFGYSEMSELVAACAAHERPNEAIELAVRILRYYPASLVAFNVLKNLEERYQLAPLIQQLLSGSVYRQLQHTTYDAHYHANPREELLALLPLHWAPRRVLELGCGAGACAQALRRRYPEACVYGVELNAQAAAHAAAHLTQVWIEDVTQFDWEKLGWEKGSIDLVIAADVLEHLYDPWQVLLKLRPYLSPSAYVLLSLPNVRQIGVLNQLAQGEWIYQSSGILDITHVRFFTLNSALHFLQDCGFSLVQLNYRFADELRDQYAMTQARAQGQPVDVDTGRMVIRQVSPAALPELFAQQFLLLAQRVPGA